jgi:tRNA threonylcarbamoyladenosine biosynthesis protein TsaB
MKLLAIESSSKELALAAFEDGQLKLELKAEAMMRQNESLAPLAQKLFEALHWKASELGAVAISLGPGSFTGLRTGLAFAKGLCFANQALLIGVPTLDAWAEGHPLAEVWLDARRGMVYRYRPGKESAMLSLEKAQAELGDGVQVLGDLNGGEAPGAAAIGKIALRRLAAGERDQAALLEPIYLRRPEAEILWEQRHLSPRGGGDGA